MCLLVGTSCHTNSNNVVLDDSNTLVLSIDKTELMLADTSIVSSSRIIPLETTDDCLIREINRVLMLEDELVVFDDMGDCVYLFDMNGEFVKKIGERGEGPQEYNQISDISILPAKKCIALLCDRPYKMMFFDYSGTFLNEVALDKYYSDIAIHNETIICRVENNDGTTQLDTYTYPMVLQENLTLPSMFSYSYGRSSDNIYSFSKGDRMTSGHTVSITLPYTPTIYTYEKSGIRPKYRIDFADKWITEDVFDKHLSPTDFLSYCREKRLKYTLENVLETSRYLLMNTDSSLLVYDKTANELKQYGFLINSVTQMGGPNIFPIPYKNSFAQIENPSHFCMAVEEKIKQGRIISTELKELHSKVTPEDNPIVIIYELE